MTSCSAIRTVDTMTCGPCRRQWDVGEDSACPNLQAGRVASLDKYRETSLDRQEGGAHYKNFAVQPIEYALAAGIDFAMGSILKYVCRWRYKNGAEDLRKAIHFVELRRDLAHRTLLPAKAAMPLMSINDFISRNRIYGDDAFVLGLLDLWAWSEVYNMKTLTIPGRVETCHRDNLPDLIIESINAMIAKHAIAA